MFISICREYKSYLLSVHFSAILMFSLIFFTLINIYQGDIQNVRLCIVCVYSRLLAQGKTPIQMSSRGKQKTTIDEFLFTSLWEYLCRKFGKLLWNYTILENYRKIITTAPLKMVYVFCNITLIHRMNINIFEIAPIYFSGYIPWNDCEEL